MAPKTRKLTTMERASLKRCYPDIADIDSLAVRATQECKKNRYRKLGERKNGVNHG